MTSQIQREHSPGLRSGGPCLLRQALREGSPVFALAQQAVQDESHVRRLQAHALRGSTSTVGCSAEMHATPGAVTDGAPAPPASGVGEANSRSYAGI